jgi:hypothetical protein
MHPPIRPLPFFLRLVPLLFLTYFLWKPVAPYYTQGLAAATRVGVWVTELSFDPLWRNGTTIIARDTNLFYYHRLFAQLAPPLEPQGIPAEWVMADLVLLIPLMLATPAASWRTRGLRLALALALAVLLQVTDIIVAIKAFYSGVFGSYWGHWLRTFYQFLDAFFQGFDTQLFPFVIWAGIHFRQLLGDHLAAAPVAAEPAQPAPRPPSNARRRREQRAAEKTRP